MTLNNMVAHLRFQLGHHGWPAAAGLALIAGALAVQFLGVELVQAKTVALRASQTAQRQRLAQQPSQENAASKRTADFYASLPEATGALEAIEVIHSIAAAKGVKLATGDYRLVREGGAHLQRYQITLPARASYPGLRAWIAEVMNAVPSAALDEISFRREDVGSDSVEARVRITLFLRGA